MYFGVGGGGGFLFGFQVVGGGREHCEASQVVIGGGEDNHQHMGR